MKQNIQDLLAKMTLEEKVQLLHGSGMWKTKGFDRLNIPDIVMTDGTHGIRYNTDQVEGGKSMMMEDFSDVVYTNGEKPEDNPIFGTSKPATCFPNGCSLACSFDTELIGTMGEALGNECQSMGVGILLGPGINIRRMPLAGRGFEYYSEDPVVSGDIAAAMIEGIQSWGVGTSLKHFACNNSEYLRNTTDSIVEERALREIYLYGFERAVKKANPWTVMSSYNLLNGEQASCSKWLLTDVLREEWGYEGLVMSDWFGVVDKVKSLMAGNDLEMPETSENAHELLAAAQQNPQLLSNIDESCLRILKLVFKLKEGEKKHVDFDKNAHHKLARKIASESMVLLKNEDQILPLDPKKTKKLAVIGKCATEPVLQGSGAASTNPTFVDIPLEEIRRLAGDEMEVRYAAGASQKECLKQDELQEALNTAGWADTVILFANTPQDENGEDNDALHLNLCPSHEELIRRVSETNHNLVVVVSNGDAIVMPWLSCVKGVLETFFSGQGMGRAAAKLLFGLANPSGRLTVTFPNTLEECPAFLHYPGENGTHLYSEGIYVGYRYYDKRAIKPLFPFGFGLSYTTFSYDHLTLSTDRLAEGETLCVTADITNTGTVSGMEVVQLYLSDVESRLPRAATELKGFVKVSLLPGETKTVTFTLNQRDFSYYDPAYKSWIFESGAFTIKVGKSERDICLTGTIEAAATVDYPQKIQLNSSLKTALAHPGAKKVLTRLILEHCGTKPEKLEELVQEKMGLLTFMNMRSALRSGFHIVLTDEEYRTLIDEINRPFCRSAL